MAEDSRVWKDRLYGQFARIGKALGSPRRLEMLDLLSQSPKSVESLARELGSSVANVSQHLQILLEAQLVATRKQGTFVIYRLANETVAQLLELLETVSEECLADVRELRDLYLTQRDALSPVSDRELEALIQEGTVYLIDVRPPSEYAAGHLPGALSIPLPELAERLQEWDPDRPIVAYCRGRYCLYARDAVEVLRDAGFSARRSEVGVREWRRRHSSA